MKIGIVTTWFERGASYVSRQYSDVLSGRHTVYIYDRGHRRGTRSELWAGERVTRGKGSHVGIATAIDLDHFHAWVVGNNLEFVLFNEQHWWYPVLLCRDLGVRAGAYVDYYTEATIPAFGCYDFLVCNTRRHLGVFDWHPQVFHVPWGTDTDLFRTESLELCSPPSVTFFHSAGWNPHRKGCDLVLDAFEGVTGDARLVVHTQASLGGLIPSSAAAIARLTGTGRLTVHEGNVPAPGLYHLGDVYVYPSRLDGIGLTVAEALACGLPAIVTDNAPMNEFVTPETGALVRTAREYSRADGYYWPVKEADRDDLRLAMQRFVDQGDEVPAMRRRAREHACASLDWSKNASALPETLAGVRSVDDETWTRGRDAALRFERQRTDRLGKLFLEAPLLYRAVRWVLRRFGKRYL